METPLEVPIDESTLVYPPAEDSFLLLDALEEDLPKFLSYRSKNGKKKSSDSNENEQVDSDPLLILEVGCGSGIISTALAKYPKLKPHLPIVFAVDVNPHAVLHTQKTSLRNGLDDFRVQPLLLEGTTSACKCFREQFDLIVCNPPYVPIHSGENPEDDKAGLLEKSWSGGADGNSFIVPFLSNIPSILRPDGALYLLLSSWNKPEELCENVATPAGLKGTFLISRKAGMEHLSVWKFTRVESS